MHIQKQMIFKYDEEDILEILSEYLAKKNDFETFNSKSAFLGTPGKNLRLISVIDDEKSDLSDTNLSEIDKQINFNGDHSFLEKNIQSDMNNIGFDKPEIENSTFSDSTFEKNIFDNSELEDSNSSKSVFLNSDFKNSKSSNSDLDELLYKLKEKRGLK